MEMKDLEKQLAEAGFHIVRQRTHKVWKDDEGHTVVTPVSSSDFRAAKNLEHQLRRLHLLPVPHPKTRL